MEHEACYRTYFYSVGGTTGQTETNTIRKLYSIVLMKLQFAAIAHVQYEFL